MPILCSKLTYYASIILNALAYLLCLKLCRHNRRKPTEDTMLLFVSLWMILPTFGFPPTPQHPPHPPPTRPPPINFIRDITAVDKPSQKPAEPARW